MNDLQPFPLVHFSLSVFFAISDARYITVMSTLSSHRILGLLLPFPSVLISEPSWTHIDVHFFLFRAVQSEKYS